MTHRHHIEDAIGRIESIEIGRAGKQLRPKDAEQLRMAINGLSICLGAKDEEAEAIDARLIPYISSTTVISGGLPLSRWTFSMKVGDVLYVNSWGSVQIEPVAANALIVRELSEPTP